MPAKKQQDDDLRLGRERRKYGNRDAAMRIVDTIIWLGWVLLCAAGLTFSMARPGHRADMFARFTHSAGYVGWDKNMLQITFAIVGVVAASGLVAFLLHRRRIRRETDKMKKSLIFLLIVSLTLFVLMLVFLGRYIY
ncbi:hypothetical protein LJC27_00060 [Christensenellaceae bacterium OttesenSCG-928-M15]|nr:hypothetical protein [Christensenellaceae bacterium OttesenSCG-928-M15]